MAMAWLWTGMVAVSLVFGILGGTLDTLSGAALEGAQSAVELCLAMSGVICLWTGVMEVMNQCGLTANLAADMLGLGNAATPLGIRAARRMSRGCCGAASNELCMLVVLNTASIQLIPSTLAGVRTSLGAADPFDILLPVWAASILSVVAGLLAARFFARIWRD